MSDADVKETAVLLHGLGTAGVVMAPLGFRLQRCGFRAVAYTYHEMRADLRENAARLSRFVVSVPGSRIHFVGHSLGGLVILRMLADHPDPRTGRVVMLGTPCQGSHVARRLTESPATRWLLGRSVRQGMLEDRPEWPGNHELGIIAGSRSIGLGLFVPGLPRPNDGMVAVEETRIPGVQNHIVLHVSHTEMLVSGKVARQVCAFLKNGRFLPEE